VTFLRRIFKTRRERDVADPLYRAIVAAARDPAWYREGAVPDTIDGRFDMIAALLALVLLRLEAEGEACREASVLLTECFIADMDGSVRQLGAGDLVVGKQVGRMVSALGGRLGAFRTALADGTDFTAMVRRNIFHDAPPSEESMAFVTNRLDGFHRALGRSSASALLGGALPAP
jgi:cytochrome b pre-mRNA-processing protein 3